MQGVPYAYGAKGPAALDCSGFTKKAYAAVGVTLSDGSFRQASSEKPLSHDLIDDGRVITYRHIRFEDER
jgi:cell wall-associated NlpC family hydrolase